MVSEFASELPVSSKLKELKGRISTVSHYNKRKHYDTIE
jgi:hypothetical protein